MANTEEMLRRAAEGNPGAPLAQRTLAGLSKKDRRAVQRAAAQGETPAAEVEPTLEPAAVDPIAAAQALLARSSEIDESYSEFHEGRDAVLEREQVCLRTYRELYGRHRSRLNDTRWCATKQGAEVLGALEALRAEVDMLSEITLESPDYDLLWRARKAARQDDFVACVLAASEPIVSASGTTKPILVAVSAKGRDALKEQGVEDKFFFRADRQTFYPNGYEHRVEVRRVVRELQQLLRRAQAGFKHERKRTEALLKEFASDRVDTAGTPLDLAKLLSVAEPSPYGEVSVDVALYISKFEHVPTGETAPALHRGVVHLSVQNTTDAETGGPAKLVTIREAVGNLERTLPAAGVRWLIPLGSRGNGTLGLRVGERIPDSKKMRCPKEYEHVSLALLWYIQDKLWETERFKETVGQQLGLAAYQRYEAWRQEKRGGKKGKGPKATTAAPASPAAQAQPAADTSATGAADGTTAGKPGKPGSDKRKRNRPKADASAGGNGVAPGTAATPVTTDGDPPQT